MSTDLYLKPTSDGGLCFVNDEPVILEAEIISSEPNKPELFPCRVDRSWQAAADRFNNKVRSRRKL